MTDREVAERTVPAALGRADQLSQRLENIIDTWTEERLRAGSASSWSYGELWGSIREALLPAITEALATARREAAAEATEQAAKICEQWIFETRQDGSGSYIQPSKLYAARIRAQSPAPSPTSDRETPKSGANRDGAFDHGDEPPL